MFCLFDFANKKKQLKGEKGQKGVDGRDGLPGLPSAENSGYVAVPGPPGKFIIQFDINCLVF